MHACWDFDASSAQTRRVSALDEQMNQFYMCVNVPYATLMHALRDWSAIVQK